MIKVKIKYILILILLTILTLYCTVKLFEQKAVNTDLIKERQNIKSKLKISKQTDFIKLSEIASDLEKNIFVGADVTKVSEDLGSIINNNDCVKEDIRLMTIEDIGINKKNSDKELIKKDNIRIFSTVSGGHNQLYQMIEEVLSNDSKYKILSILKREKDEVYSLDIELIAYLYTPKSYEIMKKHNLFKTSLYEKFEGTYYELEEETNQSDESEECEHSESIEVLQESREHDNDLELGKDTKESDGSIESDLDSSKSHLDHKSHTYVSDYELSENSDVYSVQEVITTEHADTGLEVSVENGSDMIIEKYTSFGNKYSSKTIAIVDFIEQEPEHQFRIKTDFIPIIFKDR